LIDGVGVCGECRSEICAVHDYVPWDIEFLSVLVVEVMVIFLGVLELGVGMDVCRLNAVAQLVEGPAHCRHR
jgi:hypothetical protein